MSDHLHLILTGGTIDSVFDGAKDMVVVNDSSTVLAYIEEMVRPHFEVSQEVVTLRDSREINDNIRAEILSSIEKAPCQHVLITHGTYTMPDTAEYLDTRLKDRDKIVVLTGSMLPLKGFAPSDAPFNLGFAIGSLFLAEPGIHLSMNGKLFGAGESVKNIDAGRFEGA